MKHGTCKLCGHMKPYVDAHIIPQSFYDYYRMGKPGPFTIYQKGEHPQRSQTGIYDPELVCFDCEKIFADHDDYGAKILIPEIQKERCTILPDGRGVYQVGAYDYAKLKLFLLSVLWRSSATTKSHFSGVSLGPHEEIIGDMILANNAGPPEKYSVVISRFTGIVGRCALLPPRRTRIASRHTINILFLGGYKVRIQVDSQPPPPEMLPYVLCPNVPLTVVLEDSNTCNDFMGIQSCVLAGEAMRGKPNSNKSIYTPSKN